MIIRTLILASLLFLNTAQAQNICNKDSGACDIEFISTPSFPDCIPCGMSKEGTVSTQSNVPASITITNTIEKQDSSATTIDFVSGQVCTGVTQGGLCESVIKVTAPACGSKPPNEHIVRQFVATPNTNNAPIKTNIDLTVNCPTTTPIAIASGQTLPPPPPPSSKNTDTPESSIIPGNAILAVLAANNQWLSYSQPSVDNVTSSYYSSTCTGNTSSSLCIAVGRKTTNGVDHTLLSLSTNGGVTWSEPSITNYPKPGIFEGVGCVGDGAAAKCEVVGIINGSYPNAGAVVLTLTNGGTWSETFPQPNSSVGTLESDAALYNVSVGNANDVALGYGTLATDHGAGTVYFISSGSTPNITFLTSDQGIPLDSSCSGSWCVFVAQTIASGGQNTANIIKSNDNFSTLAVFPITTTNVITGLGGVACTTTADGKIVCIAVGGMINGANITPIVYVNEDLAHNSTWTPAALPTLPTNVLLTSAACATTPDGAKAICTATGTNEGFTVQIILENIDVANSSSNWAAQTYSPGITNAFFGTACTTTTSVSCFASGGSDNTQAGPKIFPLYAKTDMVSGAWAGVVTNPTLPGLVCLSNVGANGSSNGSVYGVSKGSSNSYCEAPLGQ